MNSECFLITSLPHSYPPGQTPHFFHSLSTCPQGTSWKLNQSSVTCNNMFIHQGQNLWICLAYLPSTVKSFPIKNFPFAEIILIRIIISHVKFSMKSWFVDQVFCSYQPVRASIIRNVLLVTLYLPSPIILHQILQIGILSKRFASVHF